jgi:predicted ATPase
LPTPPGPSSRHQPGLLDRGQHGGALGVAADERREAVAARLGTGRSLLVLDNREHVIDEAAAFAERILAACPGTRVLVTSRERLGIPGERSVPISPLPLARTPSGCSATGRWPRTRSSWRSPR